MEESLRKLNDFIESLDTAVELLEEHSETLVHPMPIELLNKALESFKKTRKEWETAQAFGSDEQYENDRDNELSFPQ